MGSQSSLHSAAAKTQSPKVDTKAAPRPSRCIAIVGPYLAGKTTLLEAILERTGGVKRAGRVDDKSSVGDASIKSNNVGNALHKLTQRRQP